MNPRTLVADAPAETRSALPNLDACRALVEQLRAHDCAAMALLLERSLPEVAATTKALDVIWRDLGNIAAGRGMLADAYADLAHPRWAARERRRYGALEGLSEIALGVLQGDAVRTARGRMRLDRATAKPRGRR